MEMVRMEEREKLAVIEPVGVCVLDIEERTDLSKFLQASELKADVAESTNVTHC